MISHVKWGELEGNRGMLLEENRSEKKVMESRANLLVDCESSKLSRWQPLYMSSTPLNESHCFRVEYAPVLHLTTVFHLFFSILFQANSSITHFQRTTLKSGNFANRSPAILTMSLGNKETLRVSGNFYERSICDEKGSDQVVQFWLIDQNWDGWKTDWNLVDDG